MPERRMSQVMSQADRSVNLRSDFKARAIVRGDLRYFQCMRQPRTVVSPAGAMNTLRLMFQAAERLGV